MMERKRLKTIQKRWGALIGVGVALGAVGIGCGKGQVTDAFSYREKIISYRVSNLQVYESYKFTQVASDNKLDVVFIIDDSASMGTPIANVRAGIANFISQLRNDPSNIYDYHVGITTSDPNGLTNATATTSGTVYKTPGTYAGTFYGDPANYTTPGNPGSALLSGKKSYFSRGDYASDALEDTAFQNAVNSVSLAGHGDERVNAVMKYMMSDFLVNGNDFDGFFRPSAFKFFILITDEDDCSSPGSGARSTRLNALTAGAPNSSNANTTYAAGHPIVAMRGTSYTSVCNYYADRPDEIYNFISARGQDMARLRVYSMITGGSATSNFTGDMVSQFGFTISASTVGNISGNVTTYQTFLAGVGQSAASLVSSFNLPASATLPSPLSLVQLFAPAAVNGNPAPGPGSTTSDAYDVATSPSRITINNNTVGNTFKAATSGTDLVVRWRREPSINRYFAFPTVPDESTVSVFRNGTKLTASSDYTYDPVENQIYVSSTLVAGDEILIDYFTKKGEGE